MSYRWHSQRQGSFDAIRLTWIAIGTKRREVEKKKKNTKTKKNIKNVTQIQCGNNKRREEQLTPVLLSEQASLAFSYETLISSELQK